jgi:hypothetical protein
MIVAAVPAAIGIGIDAGQPGGSSPALAWTVLVEPALFAAAPKIFRWLSAACVEVMGRSALSRLRGLTSATPPAGLQRMGQGGDRPDRGADRAMALTTKRAADARPVQKEVTERSA